MKTLGHTLGVLFAQFALLSLLAFGGANAVVPEIHRQSVEVNHWMSDKDFAALSFAWGAPPQVILLQTGNCSTVDLIQMMRKNAIRFSEFEGDARRALLVLR